ncbi:MAG: hypothetical protein GKS00_12800 [Alphaproteobacteria bacterium]|nr:hypothetical protein [Alphaproteobacteria bacterium]
MDPYLIFGSKRIAGINAIKATYERRERTVKAHIFRRLHPTTIILGNSRSQRGFDPSSKYWPKSFRPVVNASLPGGTIYEIFRYAQHAQSSTNLKNIFITLEFEEFLQFSNPKSDARYQKRYRAMNKRLSLHEDGSKNDSGTIELIKDYGRSLFSLDAVTDSVITVASQDLPLSVNITDLGFNPLREERAKILSKGQFYWFRRNLPIITANLKGRSRNVLKNIDFQNTEAGYYFEKLLDLISQHRLNAYFVIPPYHSKYLLIIDDLGLSESFFEWQAYVTRRINERKLQNQISLWNFSGFHQFNDEPIPAAHDRKTMMKWHVEPGHFRGALGEKVIQRIFTKEVSDFGMLLKKETVRLQIQTQRKALYDYSN